MDWQTTSTILDRLRNHDDETAWSRFVERFRRPVFEFCRHAGLSDSDAEDVAQETLLAFATSYRDGKYVREKGRLSKWLFGIAYRQILRQRQRNARRAAKDVGAIGNTSFWSDLQDEGVANQTWDQFWEQALLAECLNQVRREFRPDTYRAFELAVQEDRPAAEAAESLGVSIKAVYNAKHRVLKRIRELRGEFDSSTASET